MGIIGYFQRREGGGQGDGEEEIFIVYLFESGYQIFVLCKRYCLVKKNYLKKF